MAAAEAEATDSNLKKTLSAFDLTLLGIGAIIGTGIFVLTGQAAGNNAGPAVVISYVIAGVASSLAAFCYGEMASMIPVSGSAYTYAYSTLGELVAWIIGWTLILEYLVGAATVVVGWSGYVVSFIENVVGNNFTIDPKWVNAPIIWENNSVTVTGNYVNLPAIAISLLLTALLAVGIREAAWVNTAIVIIKVSVILIFICAGAKYINQDYWHPFVPPEQSYGHYGASGIFQASTTVFFAYIGFDAVSTTAQECKNPQRDLPIGIIGSLIICTVLYIAVCVVLTGLIPYHMLTNKPDPISVATQYVGLHWLSIIVDIGAIAGLSTAALVSLLGQTRIFFAMSRDGLLPPIIGRVHPRFGTPFFITIVCGIATAILGALLPIDILGELTSIGTVFAFILVCLGVLILRITRPDIPRKFKVPLGPYFIPILGAAFAVMLICVATPATIYRLFIWMFIGLVLYFVYSRTHSKLESHGLDSDQKVFTLSDGHYVYAL